ncbi:NAD(P)-binding protein [Anianabacter salinae]|uniref:NAD(P)-binding protein n=1 Tax=Anianabacter salinae TaxID=2851023 RepID=UPI00225E0EBA|nr:NAD(P)-binding protein [Anianabacter salinae]MBV0914173.1 NAD(P)-binding protein [Anianabacter salinae]
MQHIVIIGGGYAGAMTAVLFAHDRNFSVTVVEKQNRLGGLYNSAWEHDGLHFDYGSRAILQTGVPAVDDVIFSILPDQEYPKTTENLKEFSFQNGTYCSHSNCLDARTLPADILAKGKAELLAIEDPGKAYTEYDTLQTYARATYGPTLTEALIAPAMEKLTGLRCEALDPISLFLHGLHRIIVTDSIEAKALKAETAFNDSRLAFARFDDHASSMIKTYPVRHGLSDYCDRIRAHLDSLPNVRLLLETATTAIEMEGRLAKAITLDNGETIACDHVIWSIPSIFLARVMGQDITELKGPTFRNSVLAHYVFEGEILNESYFIYNYDPAFQSYRSTFYDNFSSRPEGVKTMTVEMFHDALDPDLDQLEGAIFEEQKAIGAISTDARIRTAHLQFHRGSWPNFAAGFFSNQAEVNEAIGGAYDNIHLVGKANGKHHSSALVHDAHSLFLELGGTEPKRDVA